MVLQHTAPLGIVFIPGNTRGTFPGLIPGLAGGRPRTQLISDVHLPAPAARSVDKPTNKRLLRLETLVADMAEEIQSLRWSNDNARHETDVLRQRLAQTETKFANLSKMVTGLSIEAQAERRRNHPGYETPVPRRDPEPGLSTLDDFGSTAPMDTCGEDKKGHDGLLKPGSAHLQPPYSLRYDLQGHPTSIKPSCQFEHNPPTSAESGSDPSREPHRLLQQCLAGRW